MNIYRREVINIVDDIIDMFDVEGLVEHAISYVSVYHSDVMDFVMYNIEDSDELTREEYQYLSDRVYNMIEEYI